MTRIFRRMMRWTPLAVLLVAAALVAHGWLTPAVQAQTTVTQTTASAAVGRTDGAISLASDTGVAAGTYLYVDGELMRAVSEIGTTARWNVRRGLADGNGPAVAHRSGAKVWVMASGGSGESYYTYDQTAGSGCTVTEWAYKPFINTKTGHVFECAEPGVWAARYDNDMVKPLDFTAQDSFDEGHTVMQDDGTAKSLTDAEVNYVTGSPLGAITYREEQTKTASSWVTLNGLLDLSADDTTDNEGVEILFGGDGSNPTLNQWMEAGTQGGCVAASVTIADISGTDQVQIVFRQNEAFADGADYTTYTVWNTVGVNATDGSIVSSQEVSEATDTDDSGVNWADGETRALKVCVTKGGVPTAYYSDAYTASQVFNDYPVYHAIPMTNTGSTLTAGTGLFPFLSYLAAGTDGPDVSVNWVRLMRLP